MNYIFELNHPKHYYQFKYVMQILQKQGHRILVLARDKDVLLNVLNEQNINYIIFGTHYKGLFSKILGTFHILFNYQEIVKNFEPDAIISKASFYGTFIAKLNKIKSIIFPDSEVVFLTNKFVVPLCTKVVTPETFELNYGKKHIKIHGYFENCYLNPIVFTPDEKVIDKYGMKRPYAVFRFVSWQANHDVKNRGFSIEEKIRLVQAVTPHMNVYISSEKTLPKELAPLKIQLPSSLMHQALAFADLYLGDSQTMATEAALLGTPAIRYNSFVGNNDMSNFKTLENKHHLLLNLSSFDDVLDKLIEFSKKSKKEEWLIRKKQYYKQIGDSNMEIVEIIKSI